MSLSTAINSTVFRETSLNTKYKNILYEQKNAILDSLILLTGDNYYTVIEDNTKKHNMDNIFYISKERLELHNYHLVMSHSLEKHINSNISFAMHLPLILIISDVKSYKKEDRFLIQNKIKNYTKIFLNEDAYKAFCNEDPKCFSIKLGIPLDIFYPTQSFNKRKDICIIDNNPMTHNIKTAIDKTGKSCDIIDTNLGMNILSAIFNQYKVCIDLGDNYMVNLLCAAACGCKCITSTTQSGVPYIIKTLGLDNNFVSNICNELDSEVNTKSNIAYIKENYPFTDFIEKIHKIISHTSHEVFTL